MAELRGIGCQYCDGTGVVQHGSGRTWISGGDVHEDWYDVPCPMCTPPELPEPDYREEDAPADDCEPGVVWDGALLSGEGR